VARGRLTTGPAIAGLLGVLRRLAGYTICAAIQPRQHPVSSHRPRTTPCGPSARVFPQKSVADSSRSRFRVGDSSSASRFVVEAGARPDRHQRRRSAAADRVGQATGMAGVVGALHQPACRSASSRSPLTPKQLRLHLREQAEPGGRRSAAVPNQRQGGGRPPAGRLARRDRTHRARRREGVSTRPKFRRPRQGRADLGHFHSGWSALAGILAEARAQLLANGKPERACHAACSRRVLTPTSIRHGMAAASGWKRLLRLAALAGDKAEHPGGAAGARNGSSRLAWGWGTNQRQQPPEPARARRTGGPAPRAALLRGRLGARKSAAPCW